MWPVKPGWRMKGESSHLPLIPLEDIGTWTNYTEFGREQTHGGDEQLSRKVERDRPVLMRAHFRLHSQRSASGLGVVSHCNPG